MESLEMAGKILNEYPEKKVLIYDKNTAGDLSKLMGNKLSNELLKYFMDKGVYFKLGEEVNKIQEIDDGMILQFTDGKKLLVDMIIDNNSQIKANTNLLKSKQILYPFYI